MIGVNPGIAPDVSIECRGETVERVRGNMDEERGVYGRRDGVNVRVDHGTKAN